MKEMYLKEIFRILSAIDDVWILEAIHKFAIGMTRRD